MALIDDLIAATDHDSIAATTAINAAIDKINATRVNIAAVGSAGTLGAAQAAVAGEATTALGHVGVPTVDRAVGTLSGPAAVPKL